MTSFQIAGRIVRRGPGRGVVVLHGPTLPSAPTGAMKEVDVAGTPFGPTPPRR
jgi:hypothetical protein